MLLFFHMSTTSSKWPWNTACNPFSLAMQLFALRRLFADCQLFVRTITFVVIPLWIWYSIRTYKKVLYCKVLHGETFAGRFSVGLQVGPWNPHLRRPVHSMTMYFWKEEERCAIFPRGTNKWLAHMTCDPKVLGLKTRPGLLSLATLTKQIYS